MKRYIATVVALCALLCVTTASAQDYTFGAKIGFNIASASHHGDDVEGRSYYRRPVLGLLAGLTAERTFKKDKFALSAELLYSMQGVSYKYPRVYKEYDEDEEEYYNAEDYKVKYNFNYFNIPIMFNYKFIKGLDLKFKVGVQPGFLISSKRTAQWADNDSSETWIDNEDAREEYGYYTFDLSVPFGFEYELNDKIALEARYSLGVLDTFYKLDDNNTKDFGFTNNTFAITVGYKF